jgi:hypothetical protein
MDFDLDASLPDMIGPLSPVLGFNLRQIVAPLYSSHIADRGFGRFDNPVVMFEPGITPELRVYFR